MRSPSIWLLALVPFLFLGAPGKLVGQTADQVCRAKDNWANCGVAIRRELDQKPTDVKRLADLASMWGAAYGARYDFLRRQHHLDTATPDSEKIFEEVNSKLNPIEIAKDKAQDALLKRCLSWLATLVEWTEKPIAVLLKAFFTSSEIASDYDELRLMNDDLQKSFAALLAPYMKPDWQQRLTNAVNSATPQLRR